MCIFQSVRYAWILFLLITVCGLAFGQNDSSSFRVLGYGDHFFDGIYYKEQRESGEIRIALAFLPNQKSRNYFIPSEVRKLSFFKEMDLGNEKLLEVEVASVRFDENQKRALLVFFETSDFSESNRYEVLQLDESPDVWTAGCFRFLNLSGAELICRMGNTEMLLPFDASEIVRFDPESHGAMPLRLSVPWQDTERIVLSMRVAPDPHYPKLFVVKPPLKNGDFKVQLDTLW